MFGLDADTLRNIKKVFATLPNLEKVILYGSRAKGNYKDGSDIDITLLGKQLTLKTVYALEEVLEELYLPYTFDISIFTQIDNDDLIKHILRVGKTFYLKENEKLKTESGAKNNSQLPKGWEVKKLGEVCEILDNLRKPITKRDRIDGDYPYYGATGILSYIDDYIFDEQLVLIGEDGAKWFCGANSSFIVNGKFWVNNHAHVVRPNKNIIFDNWIVYFLNFSDLTEYITGMTVPKLNQGNLKNIQITVPPLSEQKRIVAILDRTFKTIDQAKTNAEQNLKNAKELFESYLNRIFEEKGDDWEEKTWGELIEIRSGRNQKEVLNPNGKYPVLGSAGKIMGYADKYICEKGTTVIGRKGTIDKPLFIETNFWNVDTAFGLIAGKSLTKEFLLYFCKSFNFKELDKGTTLPSLVKKDLITMSYPKSKEEQKCIVTQLNDLQIETKKLETIYQQKLDNLEEMKKSMLQKAFEGGL
ncbi:restriction endonuclease subunit S [bacterium endosymbiont of Bathymodiolus sp. 5 South]|uniref:restriction endonuclease subunit S n=1 Tax=bacterium endosymbiont of Bathymodiolus sp. 5 South TaxID=1181670 RepID=UPI0010B27E19|nr:restriction endonuclease subunit S [bacterium endosymbiont of Bathymodiolus sp. 5 South]SSC09246.1 Type I restriction-modification system, specificity subunit S [bacterium endosymbiont of Bathymodiolus sp. 5 South]